MNTGWHKWIKTETGNKSYASRRNWGLPNFLQEERNTQEDVDKENERIQYEQPVDGLYMYVIPCLGDNSGCECAAVCRKSLVGSSPGCYQGRFDDILKCRLKGTGWTESAKKGKTWNKGRKFLGTTCRDALNVCRLKIPSDNCLRGRLD